MDGASLNITQDLIQKLKEIVPQAFTEDKIDISRLQTILGDSFTTDAERYGLSWAGKSEAYKVLQSPSTATLIPNPDQSIDWDNAENIFIEGENLEVLKVLQKSYYGKVKMIYIDPPYNTGSDSFIYPDKFSETKEEYLKRVGDKDDEGFMMKQGLFRKNNKENGQYHSNWLNMMLPRLFLARNLLKDDGVIFVSIDDNEQANLKILLDEIFGEENYEGTITWRRRHNQPNDKSKMIGKVAEYILVYSRNSEILKKNGTFYGVPLTEDRKSEYTNPDNDPNGPWTSNPWKAAVGRGGSDYKITTPQGIEYTETWYGNEDSFKKHIENNRVHWTDGGSGLPRIKVYLKEAEISGMSAINFFTHQNYGSNQDGTAELKQLFAIDGLFDNPKPTKLLKALIKIATNSNEIVLDFFSGTASLAHAIMDLNNEDNTSRKYICVQLPEITAENKTAHKNGYKTISQLSKSRIDKVIEKIIKERDGKIELEKYQNLGFRKYTLASSNFKIWRGDVVENEEDLIKQMQLFTTPQKENTQSEYILWELLIKNGVPLTEKIECINLQDGAKIYYTENKKLAFVLDSYTDEVQTAVLALKPKNIICLDSLFQNNDNVKTNAQLKFEDNGISFKTI